MTPKRTDPANEPPDETTAPVPATPRKEYTQPIVRGGAYDEDGTLLHETLPEPDEHRLKKSER